MGSIYTPLVLTNTAAADCILSTHIVLTFLDSGGQAIAASVSTPETAGPGLESLAPGDARQTVLRYAQPGNLDCTPVTTQTSVQLVVNQTEVLTLAPMDWPVCPGRVADQVTLGDLEAVT